MVGCAGARFWFLLAIYGFVACRSGLAAAAGPIDRGNATAVGYTVEIKDVVFASSGPFAVVEVTRVLGENPEVVVTGDFGGIANKDGPIRMSLKSGEPAFLQVHWGVMPPPPADNHEKLTIFLHPGGIDTHLALAALPQDTRDFVVVGPPSATRTPRPPNPLRVDLVASPHQPGNVHDAYINHGDGLALAWSTELPAAGCHSGVAMKLAGTDYTGKVLYLSRPNSGSGSVSVVPPASPMHYTYAVTCADTLASASQSVLATLYYPPSLQHSCPTQFCFRIRFPASNSCFAEARCATDASEAERIEKDQNPSPATVTGIGCDLAAFSSACEP
jgi:hypothetical protein